MQQAVLKVRKKHSLFQKKDMPLAGKTVQQCQATGTLPISMKVLSPATQTAE